MNACVFLGPTLPAAKAREVLDAEFLPPVRQGDVYRAVTRFEPRVLGIIDGYFHQVPSVWHKEILWAMENGVHVFGSASMGALRAAELHAFGMVGVGEVFAAYRDGVIEDDDEVAVVHGPAETGFLAASEAMVNIRKSLADAYAEGVISDDTRQTLVDTAKRLFYARRSFATVLGQAAEEGVDAGELAALRDWLEHGRVDLKGRDALDMLAAIADLIADDPGPKQVDYRFEHTTLWEAAVSEIDADERTPSLDEWILDELRLDENGLPELRRAALTRLLARREAERRGLEIPPPSLSRYVTDFRLARGFHRGRDFDAWLKAHDLDRAALHALLEDEMLVSAIAGEDGGELTRHLLNQLRLSGGYEHLAQRARAKRRALGDAAEHAQIEHNEPEATRALVWFFTQRLGRPLPEDMTAYALESGFESAAAFRRAVVREYRYHRSGQQE